MNIKSNKKSDNQTFEKILNRLQQLVPEKSKIIRILVFLVFIILSNYVWSYSGVISIFIMAVGVGYLFDNGSNIESKVFFLIAISAILLIFSTINVYQINYKPIQAKYSKILFTDSTEKIIIYMTYPINDTIVLTPSSKKYYTAKEIGKDFNLTITTKGEFDHISKLRGNNTIEKYTYTLNVKSGNFNLSTKWKESTNKLFKDIK